jgi:hypothetical protein
VHSIVGSALDREVCVRSHVTALKSHDTSKLAMTVMVTQTSRANEACARSRPLSLSVVSSIALAGVKIPSLLNSIPLNHILRQILTAH